LGREKKKHFNIISSSAAARRPSTR